jgi:hypothetical protein
MPSSIVLVPECHIDTALVRTLVFGDLKIIDHKHGISSVAKSMAHYHNTYGASRIVVGFVDGDKKFDDVTYLSAFRRGNTYLSCHETGCRFDVWQHPDITSHYLVVMDKACDTWIYNAATAASVNFSEYKLPEDFPGFLKFTKQKGAENKPELQGVLKAIRKANPNAYQVLSDFIDTVRAQVS